MNEQHQEVELWLEKVFAGGDIPAYEVNKTTVGVLYNLMKRNENVDRDTQLVIDDHRQKAQEYRSEALRLKSILQQLNLTQDSLSKPGVTNLRTLAALALHLQTKNATDTSYMLAMSKLQDDVYKVSLERTEEQRRFEKLSEKSKAALLKLNSLQRSLYMLKGQEPAQMAQTEKKAKDLGFVQQKVKEYRDKITHMESHLNKIGVDPSIYHGELVRKSEELEATKKELAPIQAKLQLYHSLPPDVPLTKVKVEELRQKLAALETELHSKIDAMHM